MQRLLTFALTLVLGFAALSAQAKDAAIHMALGQTVHMTLDKGESTDYAIALSKGDYDIILDVKRSDDQSRNIQAKVQLLKTNGVIVDSNLLSSNEIGVSTRVGRKFSIPKPLGARLRVSHDQEIPMDLWMTVVPAKQIKLLPFGFGNTVSPAKIGTDAGVGGDLANFDSAYYSVTLPPGKWSISLGLNLPKGEDTNLQGQVDLLNAYGFPDKMQFVTVNEVGNQARVEGILVVTKPKPILLVVRNINGSKTYTYDLTIEKATD
ncbi:hypothetical protein CCAX7_26910 [Capsulimonas corticalis]|uniref:Uncharacterized protein n=1 Tax=Capsulimonas corticalis TaxID=2219043 RepID=A0A402CTR6_9BACT|nr:hypothetical protein [Capsulimonas corticalis]BDI30640.1 hypothetical protein CCAX7_26910 [Capsulimonas corticalis]